MSAAVALRARGRCSYHSAAVAVGAGIKSRDVQPHHGAADRVPEADIHLVLKIGAMLRPNFRGRAAAPSAKNAGKNIAEATTAARASASAAKIGKVKAVEIEALTASTSARRRRAESACAKAATTRISFRRCGIDVV